MIVLFPLVWPFLVIWLMVRFWRVTLLFLATGLVALVYAQSVIVGGLLLVALLVLAIRGLAAHQRAVSRREVVTHAAWDRELDLAAKREYEKMEIQADLNARAMARAAREMR